MRSASIAPVELALGRGELRLDEVLARFGLRPFVVSSTGGLHAPGDGDRLTLCGGVRYMRAVVYASDGSALCGSCRRVAS